MSEKLKHIGDARLYMAVVFAEVYMRVYQKDAAEGAAQAAALYGINQKKVLEEVTDREVERTAKGIAYEPPFFLPKPFVKDKILYRAVMFAEKIIADGKKDTDAYDIASNYYRLLSSDVRAEIEKRLLIEQLNDVLKEWRTED